jgi:hypothetical protein
MSATARILRHLAKSRCSYIDELRRVVKRYGYSEKSIYTYISRLKKMGAIEKRRINGKRIICIDIDS